MSTESTPDPSPSTLASLVTSPSALDLIRSLYAHPGPFTTVYLQTWPLLHDSQRGLNQRWDRLGPALSAQGSPAVALDAIAARLRLPAPDDTAGISVIAAADGHTVVDHALEPPRTDFTHFDTLPYVAPLLEWHQHRLAHLVVTIDHSGADIVAFGTDHRTPLAANLTGSSQDLASDLVTQVEAMDARLVVIAGEDDSCRRLAGTLAGRMPTTCRVVVDEHKNPDEVAEATVRYIFDTTARTTVAYLREFRFLASHGDAVEGTGRTIEGLNEGTADLLLIHDDPDDNRRVWVGDDQRRLSATQSPDSGQEARFVDAAIRSAVAQGAAVHIIPTTGPDGPDDNVAIVNRDPTP